jgi:tripartite-type tricarboxylate transporter receptor subunit TctC
MAALTASAEHTFNIIFSSGPGSGSVASIDAYGECLKPKNVHIVKEFKPGADGLIAINALLQSQDTDNLTNLMLGGFGVNVLAKFPDINMQTDISPLVYVLVHDMVLVTKPGNVTSVEDLIKLGKQRPINIGSAAPAGTYIAETLFKELKIPYQIIPYKTSSAALVDTMSGIVDVSMDTAAGTHTLVDGNKLKIVTSTFDAKTASQYDHVPASKYTPKLGKIPLGTIINVKPSLSADRKKFVTDMITACGKDKTLVEKLAKNKTLPGKMTTSEIVQMIKENRKDN